MNEENVQAIFKRCLSRPEDETEDKTHYRLFREENGFESQSAPVVFNKKRISSNFKPILYLYGQLKNIHSNSYKINPMSVSKKYTDEIWSQNGGTLSELLSLAYATGLCTSFKKEHGEVSANLIKTIKPTLSPKDPNFPTWWEEHKSEWEDKKKGGQEPADD